MNLYQPKFTDIRNDLEIFIVSKEDPIYQEGRQIAKLMYRKVWGTENLVDSNEYAAVVFWQDSAIANVNIQLKRENNYLQSELFFEQEHWQPYFSLDKHGLAEVSGLAISEQIPSSLSRPVIMTLILGLRIMHYTLNIRLYTTVQHEFLIKILNKGLNLTFKVNELIKYPSQSIPQDRYWQQKKVPRIYYLDPYSDQCIKACDSYFYYLNYLGHKISFDSKITAKQVHYSQFWKLWNTEKMEQLQSASH
jgi:hypothetical protein